MKPTPPADPATPAVEPEAAAGAPLGQEDPPAPLPAENEQPTFIGMDEAQAPEKSLMLFYERTDYRFWISRNFVEILVTVEPLRKIIGRVEVTDNLIHYRFTPITGNEFTRFEASTIEKIARKLQEQEVPF